MLTKKAKSLIVVAVVVIVAVLFVVSMARAKPEARPSTDKATVTSTTGTAAGTSKNGGDTSASGKTSGETSGKNTGETSGKTTGETSGKPSGESTGKTDTEASGETTDGKTASETELNQKDRPTAGFTAPGSTASEYVPYQFDNLVEYDGVVEHIFFHPVIAYPEMAFDGDAKEAGIDDWMVTVSEYNKILQSLYEKNYILININDIWSEYTDDAGNTRMKRNTLMIPEGKKPLVFSYDDVNYYEYMLENGFTYKLIIGDDGEIWSYGLDPNGNEVISQDLDAITILDKFVKEHPDFSLNGVKGCLCLTGYEGILGYRTNTDANNKTAAFEENRQREREAVMPVIERLKETGWYFGSHTWGHINLSKHGLESVKTDTEKWLDEVGSLIGETQLLFYPHGARPDGDDVTQTGPIFKYLQSKGFRVFFSVGIESYSKVKSDISAVIADRLHPGGTTLRYSRQRYLKFYDAKDIYDYDVRPNFGNSW